MTISQLSTCLFLRGKSFSVFIDHVFLVASKEPSVEMENEEKIRQEARRRLEEQLKQYRVQRHTERVSQQTRTDIEFKDSWPKTENWHHLLSK